MRHTLQAIHHKPLGKRASKYVLVLRLPNSKLLFLEVLIHHFKSEIHHFQCKIHHFKCKCHANDPSEKVWQKLAADRCWSHLVGLEVRPQAIAIAPGPHAENKAQATS